MFYLPLILAKLCEACLLCFVNKGLAAVALMDPLICWPPTSAVSSSLLFFFFVINQSPFWPVDTDLEADNASSVGFFLTFKINFVFLLSKHIWKSFKGKKSFYLFFYSQITFWALAYFRFYLVAWFPHFAFMQWFRHERTISSVVILSFVGYCGHHCMQPSIESMLSTAPPVDCWCYNISLSFVIFYLHVCHEWLVVNDNNKNYNSG